jgi:hypothetical protein
MACCCPSRRSCQLLDALDISRSRRQQRIAILPHNDVVLDAHPANLDVLLDQVMVDVRAVGIRLEQEDVEVAAWLDCNDLVLEKVESCDASKV